MGKNVVITGCLQGIGLETLDLFAENGADSIFACAYKETPEFILHLEELQSKYRSTIIPVFFDLLDEISVKEAAKQILKECKNIDVLINIAGITNDALFHMITMDQMKQTFMVNFFSQMLFTQYISKSMIKNKKGSIVNISSISGIDGNPGQLSYSASKAALIGATKTLAAELGSSGIRVNAIAPGVIATAMTKNLPEVALDRQMRRSNIHRLGLPQEVAKSIMYLASDMSSFVTGQVIRVDGGIGC